MDLRPSIAIRDCCTIPGPLILTMSWIGTTEGQPIGTWQTYPASVVYYFGFIYVYVWNLPIIFLISFK